MSKNSSISNISVKYTYTFPKAPALLGPPCHSVISRTFFGNVLSLGREAVGVLYSPSRQGNNMERWLTKLRLIHEKSSSKLII